VPYTHEVDSPSEVVRACGRRDFYPALRELTEAVPDEVLVEAGLVLTRQIPVDIVGHSEPRAAREPIGAGLDRYRLCGFQ
jgi:hypothetical protein